MAKDKTRKKKTKRVTPDKPVAPPDRVAEPLSKDIAVIRKQVVKIEYHKREVLHELWPELFLHPISQLESSIWRAYGTYKGGLTKGEVEELKQLRLEAKQIQERLVTIYYRLKFKS